MKQQTILILQGIPACGKSTFARELLTKEPNKWKRTNKDEIRLMVDNGTWSKENEKLVIEIRDSIIIKSIQNGYNVIVDDTNFHPSHIKDIETIAALLSSGIDKNNEREVKVDVNFFDTPLKTCLERDALRGDKSVGKKVIIDMYQKYLLNKNVMVQDEKAPHAYIFDVDGTIATNNGERGFYDWNKVYLDTLNEGVCNVLKSLAKNYKILIVSGRDGSCYNMTLKWLKDHDIPFDFMFMRKAGDKRSDDIVKKEIFDNFIKEKYYIEMVVDDRPKVCDMWREIGLKTLQCGDPSFEF